MSNNNQDWYEDLEEDFDLEDELDDEPQRPRRATGDAALKQVRRAKRADEKRIKEMEAELSSLRKFQREALVQKVLTEKGVNPKIASFIPSDLDSTPEALFSWLEENGDVFGYTVEKPSQQMMAENDIATFRQIDSATSNALSSDLVNDMYSQIQNAESAEELLGLIYGTEDYS